MIDYTYPSIYLAYSLFFVCFVGALFFLIRSFRDGYWGKHSEDVKYQMLQEDSENGR